MYKDSKKEIAWFTLLEFIPNIYSKLNNQVSKAVLQTQYKFSTNLIIEIILLQGEVICRLRYKTWIYWETESQHKKPYICATD